MLAAASSDLTAETVRGLLGRAAPAPLVAGAVSMTVGLLFLALRWRSMMPDRARVHVVPLTGLFVIGTLLNYALPGPVGEFVAAALAGRRFGIPAEQAFAAGIHARFVGLTVAGLVAAFLFVAIDLPVPPGTEGWIGAAVAAIAAGAALLGALSSRPAALELCSQATLGRFRRTARAHASTVRLAGALRSVTHLGPRTYALAALWALCGHACVIGGIWIAAGALGASPNLGGVAFTYAVATAGAVVLFAFPGAQVGWDAMFASLLVTTAGMSVSDALAVTLVVRAQQLLVVAGGALALMRQVASLGDDPAASVR